VVIEYRQRGVPAVLVVPIIILLIALAALSYWRQRPIQVVAPLRPSPAVAAASVTSATAGNTLSMRPSPGVAVIVRAEAPPPAVTEPALASFAATKPTADESAPAAVAGSAVPVKPDVEESASARGDSQPDAPTSAKPPETSAVARLATPPPSAPGNTESKPTPEAKKADAGDPQPAPSTNALRPVPAPKPGNDPTPATAPVAAIAAPRVAQNVPPEQPEVTKEQILDGIQRDADQKKADIEKLKALMPKIRDWELSETIRKARENRPRFHEALRDALRQFGDKAGPEIEKLCEEYGRTTDSRIIKAGQKLMRTTYATHSWASKVDVLRAVGWAEPTIFDYVAKSMDLNRTKRGGLKDQNAVRVYTAQVLLRIPLKSNKKRPANSTKAGEAKQPSRFTQAATAQPPRSDR
jgi:hypothetical protein